MHLLIHIVQTRDLLKLVKCLCAATYPLSLSSFTFNYVLSMVFYAIGYHATNNSKALVSAKRQELFFSFALVLILALMYFNYVKLVWASFFINSKCEIIDYTWAFPLHYIYIYIYMTPLIYSWVYILPCLIYLIYVGIIPLYHSIYTLLIILIYLNTSSMEKSSPEPLVFLIYHFYVQKMRYIRK
jgi:hypothetical protein